MNKAAFFIFLFLRYTSVGSMKPSKPSVIKPSSVSVMLPDVFIIVSL